MKTTLAAIYSHNPCRPAFDRLLQNLGKKTHDDEPLDLLTIIDSNDADAAMWCLRTVDGFDSAIRSLACDFALMVIHLWDAPKIVSRFLEGRDTALMGDAYAASSQFICLSSYGIRASPSIESYYSARAAVEAARAARAASSKIGRAVRSASRAAIRAAGYAGIDATAMKKEQERMFVAMLGKSANA